MKRPAGITILCVALAFLAIAGFGNAYAMFTYEQGRTVFIALPAVAYGITSLAASIGLWRRERWGYSAFLAWAVTAFIVGLTAQFMFVGAPWPKLLIFFLIMFGVLWVLARYVRTASRTL